MIQLSPEAVTILFFGGILLGVLTGYPLAIVLGGVGLIIGSLTMGEAAFALMYQRIYEFVQTYAIIAVPLFIFMGIILEKSQVSAGLYDALYIWLGRIPGGLAISTILFGTILAACLGIIAASVNILTTISLRPMLERGYDRSLATGTICAAGCLGILIPPSIMLVIYGPMAGISVGRLFMAAFLPGLLLSALYVAYIVVVAKINPRLGPPISTAGADIPLKTKILKLFGALIPPVVLIVAVLGTIFFGLAPPTEAAGIGAFAAILLAIAYRRFSLKVLLKSAYETVKIGGFVILIAGFSYAIVGIFIRSGGGDVVEGLILSAPGGKWGAFIIIQIMIFILGMFIDWLGIVLILVPIISPVVPALGFDPLWFAMMIIINLQMSFMTPPFAQAIFICRGSAPPDLEVTMGHIIRGVIPFIILIMVGIALTITFPEIILWLPNKMITAG